MSSIHFLHSHIRDLRSRALPGRMSVAARVLFATPANEGQRSIAEDDLSATYPGDLLWEAKGEPLTGPAVDAALAGIAATQAIHDRRRAEYQAIHGRPYTLPDWPRDADWPRPADDTLSPIFDWLAWAGLCAAGGVLGGFVGVHLGFFALGLG